LTRNELISVPREIFSLKHLKYLNLWANHLKELPDSITMLSDLRSLILDHNEISSLPKGLANMRQLCSLTVSDNNLISIPDDIFLLQNLALVDLRGNPIPIANHSKILENKRIQDIKIGLDSASNHYVTSGYKLSSKYFLLGNFFDAYHTQKQEVMHHSKYLNTSYIASCYYNLSWYALFVEKPSESIIAAQKTLEIDHKKVSVEANLALAFLLNNEWQKAENVYQKWKGKRFPDTKLKAKKVFLLLIVRGDWAKTIFISLKRKAGLPV
jgi:hypothetical protein